MWHPHSFCDMYNELLQDMSGYSMAAYYPQFSSLSYAPCMCAQLMMCCEPVPIVQCREDAMPFTCVPWKAILRLLSTLPPRWGAISLTLMMVDTQPCTGQPKRVSCQWWSTSWDPVDLMWRPLTRLAYIVCCLSDAFCGLSGHTCCMGTVDMDICTWVV